MASENLWGAFAKGDQRALKVYGTDRYVAYDPQKRIGVMISKLGASNAIFHASPPVTQVPARSFFNLTPLDGADCAAVLKQAGPQGK